MGRFYNFLVKLDEIDYQTETFEVGWADFKPHEKYKFTHILYLLWVVSMVMIWRGIVALIYKPARWLNDSLSVKKPDEKKEA